MKHLKVTLFFCERGASDMPLASILRNLLFATFFHSSKLASLLFIATLSLQKPAYTVHALLPATVRDICISHPALEHLSYSMNMWLCQKDHAQFSNAPKIVSQLALHLWDRAF